MSIFRLYGRVLALHGSESWLAWALAALMILCTIELG
jgi:hypothetical protein